MAILDHTHNNEKSSNFQKFQYSPMLFNSHCLLEKPTRCSTDVTAASSTTIPHMETRGLKLHY